MHVYCYLLWWLEDKILKSPSERLWLLCGEWKKIDQFSSPYKLIAPDVKRLDFFVHNDKSHHKCITFDCLLVRPKASLCQFGGVENVGMYNHRSVNGNPLAFSFRWWCDQMWRSTSFLFWISNFQNLWRRKFYVFHNSTVRICYKTPSLLRDRF